MKKTTSFCVAFLAAAAASFQAVGQTNVGQWDFANGTLAPTVGSLPLTYADGNGGATQSGTQFGSTSALGIPPINGTNANVMAFPPSGASGGYDLPTAALASVADASYLVNDYTIVMDVLFPVNTATHVRPLVQTDDGVITPDADFVVDSTGGIGAPPGPYSGQVIPNTWYRIAFAVSDNEVDEFINGVEVGAFGTGGPESRFALAAPGATPVGGYAVLFQNSTTNGAAPGYVSSIQLWNGTLSAGALEALGSPTATKIPTNIASIPSYVTGKVPGPNAKNAPPTVNLGGTVNPGGTTIDGNSISVLLDGAAVTASVTNNGDGSFSFGASPTNILTPRSAHLVSVIYSDSVVGKVTNSWAFTVFNYQNVTLPAPIYFESFDEVAEGGVPAGWVVTNHTTVIDPGLDLDDTQSDSYDNWVTIGQAHYAAAYPFTDDYTSPGFPEVKGNRRQMIPPIVENGQFLTNLCSGNLMVAESDQRGGNQVQVMFTSDYDFTGYSNICVSFHNLNEQNQDNICSVEYSVDQGTNWLPLLYMLDDGTTDADGSDVVTNKATGQIDVFATFNTARNDQAWNESYGEFIGAPISTNLIPFIRPCRNDDPVQQKRIEVFPLPAATGQSHVRLRFMQAGTGSWFFDIDNLGFYQIESPIFVTQPTPVVADYNGPATFTTQVSGPSLSYQWLFNGTNIPGANTATFTIPNTASNNIGLYSVIANNTLGAITSTPVSLSLVFTPIFITPPQDVTVAPGDPATFTVQARGGVPLSYQWLFNSNAIPGATNTTYSIVATDATNSGLYQVAVSNIFSTVVSHAANLTVYAGPITNEMVVHLKFDGDYSDSSGRGNNGTPIGSPDFEPGFLGMAVHTDTSGAPANNPATNNYVTLGAPGDLIFGSDYTGDSTDFSVSFWVKIFSQNDDQSFIGNKDWNSGGNPGWIVDTEGDGMKWNYDDNALNYPGVGSSRRDSPHVAPQLEDHGWHHVLVTFARHSAGTIYVDGALVNTANLAPDAGQIGGSIDTSIFGYNIDIGQDGTGHYTDGGSDSRVDMLVDDLAIWRRVLNRREATGIFNAGMAGQTVDQASFNSPGVKPTVEIQPSDTSANPGDSVSFYAGVLGTPALSYNWYLGTSQISGATNSTLAVTNISAGSLGGYYVVVSNAYGATTSRVAQLSYLNVPPSITASPIGEAVDPGASVSFSSAAIGGLPLSFFWLHNGSPLSGFTDTNLTLQNVKSSDAGSYQLVAQNSLGAATSVVAVLKVWSGPITSNLVAHLSFDGNLNDSSGRGNNATYANNGASASPTARFTTGLIGQAFEYTTTTDGSDIEYATFGYPTDLQFGSSNDFSVSFWAKYTNQSDDLPFIGNKDWGGSGNEGWVITTQSGGNMRVNVTGTSGSDKYSQTDFPTILKNGSWHNIVVSIQHPPAPETAYVYGYIDGVLYSKHPITAVGSVDTLGLPFNYSPDNQTAFAVNVGQDGTGQYNDGGSAYDINAAIDDLGIWRRALTAGEAAGIHSAGMSGHDLTAATVASTAGLTATISGGNIVLTWTGGSNTQLQTTTTLNPVHWTAVAGTLGASTASIPLNSGASAFFRLVTSQ